MHLTIFGKYFISQLTCRHYWVTSETQRSIPNEILNNGTGRNAGAFSTNSLPNLEDQTTLSYLVMGTGQTKILFHLISVQHLHFVISYFSVWRAKKKSLPHDFFTHCEIRKKFFFKVWQDKKTPSLMHDFFSCFEIRNKDIFKAVLNICI